MELRTGYHDYTTKSFAPFGFSLVNWERLKLFLAMK
jgi:hypothetical protein